MSTDDQKESPERQREEIIAMANRDGYAILRWYEDHGLTGTESSNRPEFQRMMADVPKRNFKAILLYEQSRFSREDVFDAMAHWKIIKDAGVSLVSVQRGEMRFDDLAGLLTALIGQHESRSESMRIAARTLSGRKRKIAGGTHCGSIPYGFDRVNMDESGNVVKRITCTEKFVRPTSWTAKLAPSSDPAIVDSVRFMFDSVIEGKSIHWICIELNKRKVKTAHSKQWSISTVRRILTNPVYIGVLRFGASKKGKFSTIDEMIVIPDAHEPIISRQKFEQVGEILKSAHRVRANKSVPGAYPLSGLVTCAHCGRFMTGATQKLKDREPHRQYRCGWRPGIEECSFHPSVAADAIESMVLRVIGEYVLCEENRPQLIAALQRMECESGGSSVEQNQLLAIREKIKRGGENLVLLDGANLKLMATKLDDWRGQERKLLERIRRNIVKPSGPGQLLATPKDLATLRDNLHLASGVLLSVALRKTIMRLTVGRERIEPEFKGDLTAFPLFGEIEFFPELFTGGVIAYSDADLWPESGYIAVADYVRRAGRHVHLSELSEELGLKFRMALYFARRAARFGLIGFRRVGNVTVYEPLPTTKSGATRKLAASPRLQRKSRT